MKLLNIKVYGDKAKKFIKYLNEGKVTIKDSTLTLIYLKNQYNFMNYNIQELKEKPIINFWVSYHWHKKLTPNELFDWQDSCRQEFYEKFPTGSKAKMTMYLDECATVIEREYLSIHLPQQLKN